MAHLKTILVSNVIYAAISNGTLRMVSNFVVYEFTSCIKRMMPIKGALRGSLKPPSLIVDSTLIEQPKSEIS